MKWVFIIGGAIAALVVIVAIVGTMLPRDHVATRSARIAAAPDVVWQAMAEQARTTEIPVVVEVSDPPRRLLTRIAGDKLPFGGTWDFRIEPDGANASRVTITENGSVYNPIFRFVSRFVMGHTATIDKFLRVLGKRFGGEATPAAA
jgi:hypothetical protein